MKPTILLLALLLLSLGLQAKDEDMPGSSVDKCFGAALPSQLSFKNTSKQDFYDFAFSVRYKDGSPVDFQIDSVKVKVRGNNRKFVPMAGGTNVYRIGAKDANGNYTDNENVDANDIFTLDIFLDQAPSKPWCVNIQPTDKNSRCIAASEVKADFGNQRTYELSLDQYLATSNLFPGVSFADRNMSGYPIDTFVLQSPTTQILNPVFLDPQGDTIPPLFYDPLTGVLLPPIPFPPGAPFHIGFGVDTFLLQMQFDLFAPLPGPLLEPFINIPFVNQPIHNGLPLPQFTFPYEYLIPPYYPEPFLQIFIQVPGSSQPPVWLGQNIMLEHFDDTMWVHLFETLGGEFFAGPLTGVQLAWTVTDTIVVAPMIPPPPLFQNLPLIPDITGYGPVPIGPISLPSDPLPPIPPRQWNNGSSRGVLIGCHMPNMDLDSASYRGDGLPKPYVPDDYAGDWNACGPVATTNSFSWLRKLYPDVNQALGNAFGQGDTAMRKMLADFSALMDRASESPVFITDFIEAKLAFIDKYKLPIRVSWQSMHLPGRSIASPNTAYGHRADRNTPAAQPGQTAPGITPEFLLKALEDSCDTEMLLTWRKTDSAGNVTYPNGHYVTLTGIRVSDGNWRIKWKDDKNQHGPGGTRQGTSKIKVDSTGLLRVDGLDNEEWGECFVSNIAIECYDPTVTFQGVRGRAFRDPSGSGSSSGATGMGGMTVNLVDGFTGDLLQSTTTAPDGSYVLDQIGDPSTPKYVEFVLPTGLTISPQNVGGNDSTDSDIDPITGISDPLVFSSDTFFTLDAGFRVPGLDITLWPQGLFNPQTELLELTLSQNGLLPPIDPFPGMGFPVPPQWPDTLILPDLAAPVGYDSIWLPATYFMPPVDWVYIGFWDSLGAPLPILSVSALILPTGQLVTPTYEPIDLFRLPVVPTLDSVFVSVWAPGHLGIITGDPLLLGQPLLPPMPFNDPLFLVPPGMDRLELSTQAIVIPMGDTNADGVIDAPDRANTWNSRNSSGYRMDDCNRDGVVDGADRAATWNNRNLQGQRPK